MADIQLPAEFKAGGAVSAAVRALQMESAADGIEPSFGVIKIKGKVWSLQYRGQNYPFMRTDENSPRAFLDVVFVKLAGTKAKTFYKDGYQPNSKERPTCWSNDAVAPDKAVPPALKQCESCALCPKNKVGSAVTDNGKPAKACSDHKRTAVFIDPVIVKTVMDEALNEPVMMRIPAGSLNDFATFGANMEAQGFPLISFVTRVGFDPTVAHQKLTFAPLRRLSDKECEYAIGLRNDNTAAMIISAGDHVVEADGTGGFIEDKTATAGVEAASQAGSFVGGPAGGAMASSATAAGNAAREAAGLKPVKTIELKAEVTKATETVKQPDPKPAAAAAQTVAAGPVMEEGEEDEGDNPEIDDKLAKLLAS